MYLQKLKNIMISRELCQADLARMAGVSRAAVTKWFSGKMEKDWVNVETKSVFELSRSLGVSPEIFFEANPSLSPLTTTFLWDHLYADMESFLCAALRGELRALGRLVEILGLYEAMHVVGKKAITRFEKYKRYLPPARRKGLEALWPLYRKKI